MRNSSKTRAIRLQIADVYLNLAVSFLNFDFASQKKALPETISVEGRNYVSAIGGSLREYGMNNPRGFRIAAKILAELRGRLDPILDAYAKDRPSAEVEEGLVEEINNLELKWDLEPKLTPTGQIGEGWFIRPSLPADKLRALLLGTLGLLLLEGALRQLKICERCRRYFRHRMGRPPNFCSYQCRTHHYNDERMHQDRVASRIRQLVRLAKNELIDLTDVEKRRIEVFIGMKNFIAIRDQLSPLTDKKTIEQYIGQLREPLRGRLAMARPRKRPQAESRGRKIKGGRNKKEGTMMENKNSKKGGRHERAKRQDGAGGKKSVPSSARHETR